MKEVTDLEMCERLIFENREELTKCRLMDRLHQRMRLGGEKGVEVVMAPNQSKIKILEHMLKYLLDMHKTILEENKKTVDNKATVM